MKISIILLTFCLIAAAQTGNRVVDVEAALPESLRPIDERIHRLENVQRTEIDTRRATIANLQVRLSRNPGDVATQGALEREQAGLSTAIFDTETQISAEYDHASVNARALAAAVIPCPAHPPIQQQRDRTRQQLDGLVRRAEADRKFTESGDSAAAARLPLLVQEIEEARTLLDKLAAAAAEEASQCQNLSGEQSTLRNYADRMELRGDIHLLKAAQMAMNSLISLIRLRALAEHEVMKRAIAVMEGLDKEHYDINKEHYDINKEVERIRGMK